MRTSGTVSALLAEYLWILSLGVVTKTMNRHSVSAHGLVSRGWVWRVVGAVVALLNDRLLPERYHLDTAELQKSFETVLSWCQQYLADRNPGAVQYRGLPLKQPIQTRIRGAVIYRGCRVLAADPQVSQVKGAGAGSFPKQPERVYSPWYQQRIKSWRIRLGFADADVMQSVPLMQTSYRGREL